MTTTRHLLLGLATLIAAGAVACGPAGSTASGAPAPTGETKTSAQFANLTGDRLIGGANALAQ